MKKILVVAIAIAVTFSTVAAYAISKKVLATHTHSGFGEGRPFDTSHSGGLDKNGGHHDRKNGGYHYHR